MSRFHATIVPSISAPFSWCLLFLLRASYGHKLLTDSDAKHAWNLTERFYIVNIVKLPHPPSHPPRSLQSVSDLVYFLSEPLRPDGIHKH